MSAGSETDDLHGDEKLLSKTSLRDELIKIIEAKGVSISVQELDDIALSIATRFSGPIPPPEHLAEYERILPGCAERLISAFERQHRHRIQLEDRTNRHHLRQNSSGQIMGGLMVLICMGVTGWMGFLNHTVLAGTIGTTTVVSLATIYFLGKKTQQPSPKSKGLVGNGQD